MVLHGKHEMGLLTDKHEMDLLAQGALYARAGDPLFKPLDGEFSMTFGAQLQDCSEGSILILSTVREIES